MATPGLILPHRAVAAVENLPGIRIIAWKQHPHAGAPADAATRRMSS
jgi:hypothetical protein